MISLQRWLPKQPLHQLRNTNPLLKKKANAITMLEATTEGAPKFKRILLKLSGEALMGSDAYGINRQTISDIVAEIKSVVDLGVQLGVVIGGGNIFRGVAPAATGMDRCLLP